jgi:hypothetical protein
VRKDAELIEVFLALKPTRWYSRQEIARGTRLSELETRSATRLLVREKRVQAIRSKRAGKAGTVPYVYCHLPQGQEPVITPPVLRPERPTPQPGAISYTAPPPSPVLGLAIAAASGCVIGALVVLVTMALGS